MLQWMPIVMVRIVACFCAGIVLGFYFPDLPTSRQLYTILVPLVAGYFCSSWLLDKHRMLSLVSGFVGLTAITLCGFLSVAGMTDNNDYRHFSHKLPSISYYEARIVSITHKRRSLAAEVAVDRIRCGSGWYSCTGKVLIYLQPDSVKADSVPTIGSGTRLLIKGAPSEIRASTNPDAFDLKAYLRLKNIAHRHSIRAGEYSLVGYDPGNTFSAAAREARAWAELRINRFVKGERERAITLALVLGVTQEIDAELQTAYSASGATHVLSVSGLHVGIIYAIVLLLLKPLRSFRTGRWIIAVVSLVFLWGYALITGLSPSVLRAVLMFSFVVIAAPIARNSNIYNTLAGSAFLILVCDPFLLFNVGFQLSYLAVIGIIYLYPIIYNGIAAKNYVLNKVWQMTAVSIAAQLATFPLTLYYFHQFPVYSLISNLVVIPLSTAVLVGGITLLIVSPLAPIAAVVSWIVGVLVRLLNGAVFITESLPGSVIENININLAQCFILMLFIVAFVLMIQLRQLRYLKIAFTLVVIFSALQWLQLYSANHTDELVIYDVPGRTVIDRITNAKSSLYCDSISFADPSSITRMITPHRIRSAAVPGDSRLLDVNASGISLMRGKHTLVAVLSRFNARIHIRPVVDYLVIRREALPSISALADKIRFKVLILDSSNRGSYCARISRQAIESRIALHDVHRDGALVIIKM